MEARTSPNISDDRRVVLTALREVPEEVTFLLSDAEQDPVKPNRYWFDFPNQWANQPNKDPIIGIRGIYFTKTNRFIRYSYKVELIPTNQTESIDTIEGTINHWLDGGGDMIHTVTKNFNQYWLTDGTRTSDLTDQEHKWKDWEIQSYYGYDRSDKKAYLYFGRGILESDTVMITDSEDFEHECSYKITITPLSDDAKVLFRSETIEPSYKRVAIPTWSLHQCLVKSSIATNDKNNILGHTRTVAYNPIKYYRLNNGIKKFWIELYETRFHDCPVSFGTKVYETDENEKNKIDRDDLIIEAIVTFTAQGMI